jgi:hypothetical protein
MSVRGSGPSGAGAAYLRVSAEFQAGYFHIGNLNLATESKVIVVGLLRQAARTRTIRHRRPL